MDQNSAIQTAFRNSTVLITGGFQFIGKLVIEKLLRTTDLKQIYVLDKFENESKRIEELFQDSAYVHVQKYNKYKNKVKLIQADCALPDLGLTVSDKSLLINEVKYVIHCYSTLKYNESLKTATEMNVRATRDLIEMAKKMQQLKSFVHVSTAFSNCNERYIDEIFYKPRIKAEKLITAVEALDADYLHYLEKKLIGDFPNTHYFTRQIAEDVVKTEGKDLPICIVRPSLIGGTAEEPLSGYVGSCSGVTGLILGITMGVVRPLLTKPKLLMDIMPADYVVNNIIAAAWQTAKYKGSVKTKKVEKDEVSNIAIYNCVSSVDNYITTDYIIDKTVDTTHETPTNKAVWYPFVIKTKCYYYYLLLLHICYALPAQIIDFFFVINKRNAWVVQKLRNNAHIFDTLAYFTNNEWVFNNKNNMGLWNKLSQQDQILFKFNPINIDWEPYFAHYFKGIRVYVLKDSLETITAAQERLQKLKFLHSCLVAGVLISIFIFIKIFLRIVF